jgi:hypothetical protein
MVDDNVVVANEATAGAYTGITVNGSTETITITSDHTLQEIYDYCQWWSTQSANVQYDVPLTSADGNTFILANNWDIDPQRREYHLWDRQDAPICRDGHPPDGR